MAERRLIIGRRGNGGHVERDSTRGGAPWTHLSGQDPPSFVGKFIIHLVKGSGRFAGDPVGVTDLLAFKCLGVGDSYEQRFHQQEQRQLDDTCIGFCVSAHIAQLLHSHTMWKYPCRLPCKLIALSITEASLIVVQPTTFSS